MNPDLLRALTTVAFGAVAGGITNAVAVWMLFHPYDPPKLFGRRFPLLQGAIPKNKPRLAGALGKTVGQRLLTAEDLARTLSEPRFREAFDQGLSAFIRSLLEERRGSLREMLPESAANELHGVLLEVADRVSERVRDHVASDEFRETAHRWAAALAAELRDRPLAELLTPERESSIANAADRWIAEAAEGEGFAVAIRDYLERGTRRLLRPGRTVQELLPQGLVAALERAIAGYLPIALERLGGLLEDPRARDRVETVLHEVLDRFMRDLKFHQRLVAALIITPETIDKVLKAVEDEGATKISELFQDPDVRDAMARGVNNAIVDFLEKPVTSVFGEPEDESVQDALTTVEGWVLSIARDDQTRSFLVEKLRATMTAAERRTWGELFEHVSTDRIADAAVAAAKSERAGELYRDAIRRGADMLLDRPLGRIADHLPPDATERIERAVAEPLWAWIQQQVPPIVQRVDISARVEQKVLDYPTAQLEALIKGVTERELQLIVRLGYVLGGMIGLMSAGISFLF